MEEDLPSKWKAKTAGVAILASDKTDFKPRKIKKDKEGHYIRQVLNDLQRNLDCHTIIMGDFNTPLSVLDM